MKDCDMPSTQPKSPFSCKNIVKTYMQNSIKKTIKKLPMHFYCSAQVEI